MSRLRRILSSFLFSTALLFGTAALGYAQADKQPPVPGQPTPEAKTSAQSVVGGATSTVGSTVGATANSTLSGAGATVDAASRGTLGAATGADLSTPIQSIRIQSNAQGENQTGLGSVLSTRRGDLRLESGTRLQLQVAADSQSQAKSK